MFGWHTFIDKQRSRCTVQYVRERGGDRQIDREPEDGNEWRLACVASPPVPEYPPPHMTLYI